MILEVAWIENANAIIALIGGLVGLLATGIPLIITIVKLFKNKNKGQIWSMIQTAADAAIKDAEASGKSGADKKTMVINAVTAALKTQGIDISAFTEQLSAYIDNCISFANSLNK